MGTMESGDNHPRSVDIRGDGFLVSKATEYLHAERQEEEVNPCRCLSSPFRPVLSDVAFFPNKYNT